MSPCSSRYPKVFRSFYYKLSLHTEKKSKYPSEKIRKRITNSFYDLAIECYRKQNLCVENKRTFKNSPLTSSPCIVFLKTSFCFIFHRHMLLRMNLFDKIIKHRCICSFCRHFVCKDTKKPCY